MASGPDQSNELSVLDGDSGSVSLDFQDFWMGFTALLEYFDCLLLG